jgi:hypothetical protein
VAFSPNGRTVAAAFYVRNCIKLYDTDTGREQANLNVTLGTYPTAMAFSPDGSLLAVNSSGTGVRLLNVPLVVAGPKQRTGAATLRTLWEGLASVDAAMAYRSYCQAVLAGEETVKFLKTKLCPVPKPPADQLARLIRELDNDRYAVRVRATQELKQLGEGAGPLLRRALARDLNIEARRRIEAVLASHANPRQERAVDILEAIGDPAARRLLRQLAAGLPGARLTDVARSALDRLTRRTSQTH